jgi:hypothetical protein
VRSAFGCPLPEGLTEIVGEACSLGVEANALARFFGQQFGLVPLGRILKERKLFGVV